MSSSVDVYTRARRARYGSRPLGRRRTLEIKVVAFAIVILALWLGFVRIADGGGRTGTDQLVVQPGQTLWSIAQARYPDDDTRSRVSEIVQLNHIGAEAIYAGETLAVPAR